MNTLPHFVDCASFGVRFRLAADSAALLGRMLECTPFGTQPSADSHPDAERFTLLCDNERSYRLLVGEEPVAEAPELQPVLIRLTTDLMVHVANYAPDRVFMHAGVIGWQDRALLLPGTSFAGKTTLVAELVRAGATYYSDEYAVLDEHGRVHPYPRELQMRQPGGREQTPMSVKQLQGYAGTASLPVSHVVFANFVEGSQWEPQPVSAGLAVLEMLRHSIPVQRTPARVMATLAKMMESATALASERGEAPETARALLLAMSEGGPEGVSR